MVVGHGMMLCLLSICWKCPLNSVPGSKIHSIGQGYCAIHAFSNCWPTCRDIMLLSRTTSGKLVTGSIIVKAQNLRSWPCTEIVQGPMLSTAT